MTSIWEQVREPFRTGVDRRNRGERCVRKSFLDGEGSIESVLPRRNWSMLRRRRRAMLLRAAAWYAVGVTRPSVRHCEQRAYPQFMVRREDEIVCQAGACILIEM